MQDEPVDRPSYDGKVLAQSPAAGREVERGSRVTITVGRFDPDLNPDPDPGEEEPPPEQEGAANQSGGALG